MYLNKLIILLFLLIFINISNGNKFKKCFENKGVVNRRYKRGPGFFSCLGKHNFQRKGYKNLNSGGSDNKGESSSKGELIIKETKKDILYIFDNFNKEQVQFNLLLINILRTKYIVDVIVYIHRDGIKINNEEYIKIQIDELKEPIDIPLELRKRYALNFPLIGALKLENYKDSFDYHYASVYKEIIKNQLVNINDQNIGIYDYLLKQNYLIGIANFKLMAGPFAVFELLNIRNTINVSSGIFDPSYLQFIGINVEQAYKIPVFKCDPHALPGDWDNEKGICNTESERYKENRAKQDAEFKDTTWVSLAEIRLNSLLEEGIINEIPKYINLFKNIKYHFVNQNKFGIFDDFPKLNKIVYIGGILVEEKGMLNKQINRLENKCVVFLSFDFGNKEEYENNHQSYIFHMFEAFALYNDNCLFKIQVDAKYLLHMAPLHFDVKFFDTSADQQEILSDPNIKVFISKCDLNSLNNALYAGVPLLCIPFNKDEYYNSSIVEQLGIGIYAHKSTYHYSMESNFKENFKNALNELLTKNTKYLETAQKKKEEISTEINKEDKFLKKITELIG